MTNQITSSLGPVSGSERIKSIDVIRGIALLGILLMNIIGFGLAMAYSDPTNAGGSTGWNLKVWIMDNMLFEGTMRGLFTMLFGAGFILLTKRGEEKGGGIKVADIYYRRILWLLLFGVIHAYLLLWYGDILYPYAIFGLMLFPFRHAKPKFLVTGAIVLLSFATLLNIGGHQEDLSIRDEGIAVEQVLEAAPETELEEKQEKALESWEKFQKRGKNKERIEATNEANQGGYWSIVSSRLGVNQYFQTTLMYELWFYDILSFLLLGIAFFKWGIFQGERSFKFYFLFMLVGYAIGLTVNYYETQLLIANNFSVLSLSEAEQTYQLGRLFTTIGHIGLFMLFIKSGVLRFLQNALAAVGRMALTNYLMHTVICIFIFLGFGFGMFGKLQRYELYYVVAAIWILQLVYSPIWLKYFKYGPAEWLWRSLTYMKKQPFRRTD